MEVDQVYASAGVNRAYHCLAAKGSTVLQGASNAVAVLQRDDVTGALRMTRTLNAHKDKVNCVRWARAVDSIFLSSSVDKTVVVWKDMAPVLKMTGHSESVTSVDSVTFPDGRLTVVSASGDGHLLVRQVAADMSTWDTIQDIQFKGGSFALNVRLATVPTTNGAAAHLLFACMDSCKVDVYAASDDGQFHKVTSLTGHEDWCQCVESAYDPETKCLLVATGGQDHFIRVWRLAEVSCDQEDRNSSGEIKLKEVVFELPSSSSVRMSVRVDTILSGHEDRVTGLEFLKEDSGMIKLVSCSMDKTMIVWTPSSDGDGVWSDSVRVGEVGGNTLGFFGCQWLRPDHLLGYSFNGALHSWMAGPSDEEGWHAGVVCGGHFDSVQDLDWESEGGRYLVSTSLDQTTRVHAQWRDGAPLSRWHEIARPQVHGHDLYCLVMLPSHKMASGAEEKIVRAFESPQMFMSNYGRISGDCDVTVKGSTAPQGASVPSLGLSNKPVVYNDASEYDAWNRVNEDDRHVKDKFPDFYFNPETHEKPPPEETLVQNTLWPEVRKLYGHGNELYSLATNGRVIASASRASKADQAEVILWDPTSDWSICQRLQGHTLTVTQMEFSPKGDLLLTVSRDRTWCLFKASGGKEEDGSWSLVGKTDKSTSVHQRLLWCCSWSQDSRHFATGSRDKKVAVWSVDPQKEPETGLGICSLACKAPMAFDSPVTALAFLPIDKRMILAVGLDNGKIAIVEWCHGDSEEWKVLVTLDSDQAHHKTVKRLKVRPGTQDSIYLASCSDDHFVKIHQVRI